MPLKLGGRNRSDTSFELDLMWQDNPGRPLPEDDVGTVRVLYLQPCKSSCKTGDIQRGFLAWLLGINLVWALEKKQDILIERQLQFMEMD